MQRYNNNRRRTQLSVESLEGKTLLSAGLMAHHVRHHVAAAPLVAQQSAAITGTLTGPYSNVSAPGFANILIYSTSGTLSGVGSARLRGSLFVRGNHAGRFTGQFQVRNHGGKMIFNVFRTATLGTYTYKVAIAKGNDAAFKGATGTLTITQDPTFHVPFFTSGDATMTFS
jgi:hypothetical protein